jgi:hypothetical protein
MFVSLPSGLFFFKYSLHRTPVCIYVQEWEYTRGVTNYIAVI